jgi:hypothetical protein
MADPVEDKTRRNFCEYFYFSRAPYTAASPGNARQSDARAKLAGLFGDAPAKEPGARGRVDKLFGAAPTENKPSEARDRLDALFRKKPDPETEADAKE